MRPPTTTNLSELTRPRSDVKDRVKDGLRVRAGEGSILLQRHRKGPHEAPYVYYLVLLCVHAEEELALQQS